MISFFREKSTPAILGIVAVTLVTRAFFWSHGPAVVTAENDGVLYYLLSPLSLLPGGLIALLYLLIVMLQALRLNYALNETRMLPKHAFTTAVAYILLTALLPSWNNLTPAIVANSMIIWLIFRFIRLYNTPRPKTVVYNIGLITGTTILLYFPAAPLVIVAFFALASLRPFHLNEWIILLIGIITPFYFIAGWLFLDGRISVVWNELHVFELQVVRPYNLVMAIITFCISTIAITAGIVMWQSNSGRMVIQARRSWGVLFIMLLVSLPVVYFMRDAWPNALLLAVVPAAAFVSNSFIYPRRNLVPALIFWTFVALIIYNNWYVTKI